MISRAEFAAAPFCRIILLGTMLAAGSLPVLGGESTTTSPLTPSAGSNAPVAERTGDTSIVAGDVLTLRVGTWDLVEDRSLDWAGVDGDYTVQSDGTIMVPFAGSVPVAGQAPRMIVEHISAALRGATGVQSPPAVVVEISSRRPIYVSGDVTTPGAIEFREGLTVRQAIALAGGPVRFLPTADSTLLGHQAQIRERILRTDLRIARLEAELAGNEDFVVPDGLDANAGLQSLVAVERRLMQAREASLAAQTASVDELIGVLGRVKSGLEEQIGLVEADVERAQEELARRQELLERGLTRESDVSNAETSLSNLRLRLVEMNTQYLTLEKDLSEARRSRDTLGQTRGIEVLQELSEAQDQRRDLDLEATLVSPGLGATGSGDPATEIFLIEAGSVVQMPVEPETQLRPGDTLILEAGIE